MANDINIDSLSIEIKTSADKAATALTKLELSLNSLSRAVSNVKGLTRISNQLDALSQSVAKFTTVDSKSLENVSRSINNLTLSLSLLKSIGSKPISSFVSSLKAIPDITSKLDSGTLENFQNSVRNIASTLTPLTNLGTNSLAPFISSLKQIPKITNSIDTNTLTNFKNLIQNITNSLKPLANLANNSATGLSALNGIIQQTVRANGNLAASNAAAEKSFTSLISKLTSLKAKTVGVIYVFRRIGKVMASWLEESNAYVENLNLFTVAMGDATKEALDFANAVNDALGIDQSEFIRNMGVFKSIATGFGVITEKANLMAQNLTQIGYDISSFYNIKIEDAMQKVQSGISGELEPLIVAA